MLQQIFVDSQFSDIVLGDGSHVFWLGGDVTVPDRHSLQVKLLNAWIPHTFYTIFDDNDTLNIRYFSPGDPEGSPETIVIPHGNRSIDEIIDIINPFLEYGYSMGYDVATNKLAFSTESDTVLVIDPGTTCNELLGIAVGDSSANGVLRASKGVDLTRTSSIFIRSNLHTENRDPVTRRTSDILAKIPLTSQFNELEHFSSQAWVDSKNKQLSYLIIKLVDDHGRLLDLNGARFTLTVKLHIEKDDEPIEDSVRALASQREAESRGGQLGTPSGDNGSKQSDRRA